MKRKTLHIPNPEWEFKYSIEYISWQTVRYKHWRVWFQTKGVVTCCGLRVHTLEKLASPEEATCSKCKHNIGLQLLANT